MINVGLASVCPLSSLSSWWPLNLSLSICLSLPLSLFLFSAIYISYLSPILSVGFSFFLSLSQTHSFFDSCFLGLSAFLISNLFIAVFFLPASLCFQLPSSSVSCVLSPFSHSSRLTHTYFRVYTNTYLRVYTHILFI